MSDGISIEDGNRKNRRRILVGRLCEEGLEEALFRAGASLRGMSVKYGGYEVLVTLRADLPAGPMVAFIGAETLAGCLLKARGEANKDQLRWREDRYAKG
jgi:hypothetical protein